MPGVRGLLSPSPAALAAWYWCPMGCWAVSRTIQACCLSGLVSRAVLETFLFSGQPHAARQAPGYSRVYPEIRGTLMPNSRDSQCPSSRCPACTHQAHYAALCPCLVWCSVDACGRPRRRPGFRDRRDNYSVHSGWGHILPPEMKFTLPWVRRFE